MKGTVKGRSSVVVAVSALAVVGFSIASNVVQRIGEVNPRVRIEQGAEESNAAQNSTYLRLQLVNRAMTGEVAGTADRLREAALLAASASLILARERTVAGAKGWNILQRVKAQNLLPPGAVFTDQANLLATPYGSLILYFRSSPLGVEVVSIGKDATMGPALIVRVAPDIPDADGKKVWMAKTLDRIQLPRPFADESEVIAAGWQVEKLVASK